MISHTHVGTNDFAAAFGFYSAVLGALGLRLRFSEPERHWAGWEQAQGGRPYFLVGRPFDGGAAAPGNGPMVALLAADRATVDRVYHLAMEHGGVSEGAPGLRPHYHANYYGAYFRDPDGNKLCICCHEPK